MSSEIKYGRYYIRKKISLCLGEIENCQSLLRNNKQLLFSRKYETCVVWLEIKQNNKTRSLNVPRIVSCLWALSAESRTIWNLGCNKCTKVYSQRSRPWIYTSTRVQYSFCCPPDDGPLVIQTCIDVVRSK